MATELRRQGVGPDVLVGLCAERSLEMVIGLLGIVQAGGAYVPIDPSYPADRIAYMLADAAPSVLLTQPALRGQLPPFAGVCLELSAAATEASDGLSADAGAAGPSGLHDLYVRLHRASQRGGEHAWRIAQSVAVDAGIISA